MNWNIQITRSNRKTLSLQIKDGKIMVRAPLYCTDREITEFVKTNENWIRTHWERSEERKKEAEKYPRLTMEEMNELADKALKIIPERVRFYAPKVGVTYGRITIRNQKTRWGSCSSKGDLNFNCLLMLMPPQVIDSVVVHELCHRKEMNHSKRFYDEVLRVFPEYTKWNQWLKENGGAILMRMTG